MMKVGDKVECIEGDLEGWAGVIVRVLNNTVVEVDLDEHLGPNLNLKGLLFYCDELELIK